MNLDRLIHEAKCFAELVGLVTFDARADAFLTSRTTEESLCDEPGHPNCEEHQAEIEYLEKLDMEYQELERPGESITSLAFTVTGEFSVPALAN
jgi:hypothetical protein